MRDEQIALEKGCKVLRDGRAYGVRGKLATSIWRDGHTAFSIKRTPIGESKNAVVVARVPVYRVQAYLKYGDKIYEDGVKILHANGNVKDNSWNNIILGNATMQEHAKTSGCKS